VNEQRKLALDMMEFLKASPRGEATELACDLDFLYCFEAARHLIVRSLLERAGVPGAGAFEVLDFGYLNGLTQEFLHRAFPGAHITVCDLPSSPNFSDLDCMAAVKTRPYLTLLARNIDDIEGLPIQPRVIVLGEVIEHLDPTQVARALAALRKLAGPGCVLVVTTPNSGGVYNCYMTMTQGAEVTVPPIPNPLHGYGHIHLWSPNTLRKTAEHFGWTVKAVEYYHGREAEAFARLNRHWDSFKGQVLMRGVKLAGDCFPKLRGFFVATFTT
jgi:2-polyprenyl-3-methyl-5-hydroxy-6-metoxy-1,4-benzoquinol methylase